MTIKKELIFEMIVPSDIYEYVGHLEKTIESLVSRVENLETVSSRTIISESLGSATHTDYKIKDIVELINELWQTVSDPVSEYNPHEMRYGLTLLLMKVKALSTNGGK